MQNIKEELEEVRGISQPEPEPEQNSENQPAESSITEEKQHVPLLPSSELNLEVSAEPVDTFNPQENTPNRQDDVTSRPSCFNMN